MNDSMAITRQFAPAIRALHVPRPGSAARRFVIGALLGVVIVLGALVAISETYANRILPGVVVGGVDVSGLTREQAHAALTSDLSRLEDGTVTVHSAHGWVVIPYAVVDRAVDYETMLDSAAAVGRGGTRFDELLTGLRQSMRPVSMPTLVSFDRDRLADELAAFADRGYRQPLDASVLPTKGGYVVSPSVAGVRVDTSRVAPAIEAALADPATPATTTLTADAVAVPPVTSDADAVRAKDAARRISAPLYMTRGDKKWKITSTRIRQWITFAGAGAGYGPQIDTAKVPEAFKNVAKYVKRAPTEARFIRTRSGAIFGVSASHLGRALDVKATAKAVAAALTARAAGQTADKPVKVKTMQVAPALSTDEATKKAPLLVKVGSWTTRYVSSERNGFGANIKVPARRLDGIVVRPGQTFDFWDSLGEVSFRTGYRLGAAIVGGHTVVGRALAGGICSVSTTLFNAAARGGLQIVTRSPHFYYIDRYPLGLDATVSGSQSMRFRNDTKFPILIKASASSGSVTFEIWSVPNGRTVTWSKPSVRNVVRGYDTVQKTASLPRGDTERTEYPVDGKDVAVTRTVRSADGRVIHRDTFVSNYHRMVGITLVGTG
jgi:vancomycin resistance protein YoaR